MTSKIIDELKQNYDYTNDVDGWETAMNNLIEILNSLDKSKNIKDGCLK
jgi:hypothetical protein